MEHNELNDIQMHLLGLLQAIHHCCIKNNIRYSLHGGTLLGAIRNKGFIPWDDDADISMTRRNYEKFIKTIKEDSRYHLSYTHLNQVTQVVSEEYPDAWVDIFVYDFIDRNVNLQKIKCAILVLLNITVKPKGMLTIRKTINDYPTAVRIVYDVIFWISGFFPMKWRRSFREFVASRVFCGDKTLVFKSNDQFKGIKEIFPVSVMKKFRLTEFETTKLMISTDYEVMLTTSYGKDYMTPVKYGDRDNNVHEKMRKKMRTIK